MAVVSSRFFSFSLTFYRVSHVTQVTTGFLRSRLGGWFFLSCFSPLYSLLTRDETTAFLMGGKP